MTILVAELLLLSNYIMVPESFVKFYYFSKMCCNGRMDEMSIKTVVSKAGPHGPPLTAMLIENY